MMGSSKDRRVVITGLGVVSPIGIGVETFTESLIEGKSGISFDTEMEEYNFCCQVSGKPPIDQEMYDEINRSLRLIKMRSRAITYGMLSIKEAWEDAGLKFDNKIDEPRWDTGCIYGIASPAGHVIDWGYPLVLAGNTRRLGGNTLQQIQISGIVGYVAKRLGLGNATYTTAQACATGTNAIILSYERIKNGRANRMITGSSETDGKLIWSGFDSLHALCRIYNDNPKGACRPMSASASGVVPSSGAATLILEEYEIAKARGAKIYAEIIGTAYNTGGQMNDGSMTMPSKIGVVRVIKEAMNEAGVKPKEIDVISGHLTATTADPKEIAAWSEALQLKGKEFPLINALKSILGHGLSSAGSMAILASVLQIKNNFVHASLNCEDLHPEIAKYIDDSCIPHKTITDIDISTVIQASFGFGDTNAAIVLREVKD